MTHCYVLFSVKNLQSVMDKLHVASTITELIELITVENI